MHAYIRRHTWNYDTLLHLARTAPDFDDPDNHGCTLLYHLVSMALWEDIQDILLDRGANVNHLTSSGDRPLDVCRTSFEFKQLMHYGADPDLVSGSAHIPSIWFTWAGSGGDPAEVAQCVLAHTRFCEDLARLVVGTYSSFPNT